MIGSVDFSMVSGVRETLTGRIGLTRLYPFTVAEISSAHLSKRWSAGNRSSQKQTGLTIANVQTWLERGGMPGICWLGDQTQRNQIIEDWLQSICYRDLMQLKGARYDGALAREILTMIADKPAINQADMAKQAGVDSRIIKKHLNALEALYVIYRIRPLQSHGGTGSDKYYIFDAAIARYLEAPEQSLYGTLMINEVLAQHEYNGLSAPGLFYYASRGATKLDLVIKSNKKLYGFLISNRVEHGSNTIRSLSSLRDKKIFASLSILAPVSESIELAKGIKLESYVDYC